MKLAVTGGTGFVGAHLLDVAIAAGHQVKALTRREQPARNGLEWIVVEAQHDLACQIGTNRALIICA